MMSIENGALKMRKSGNTLARWWFYCSDAEIDRKRQFVNYAFIRLLRPFRVTLNTVRQVLNGKT